MRRWTTGLVILAAGFALYFWIDSQSGSDTPAIQPLAGNSAKRQNSRSATKSDSPQSPLPTTTRSRDFFELIGSVNNDTGEPIAGARIEGVHVQSAARCHALSAGDGTYRIEAVRSGAWNFRCTAPGYFEKSERLVTAGRAIQTRLDWSLLASTIEIRFRLSSREPFLKRFPLATYSIAPGIDLSAIATLSQPEGTLNPSFRAARNRDGVGRFELNSDWRADPLVGDMELRQPPPVWVSVLLGGELLETRQVVSTAEPIEFTVDSASVESALATVNLRIVDGEKYTPVRNARVALDRADRTTGTGGEKVPDNDGNVTLSKRIPGLHMLIIHAPGRETIRRVLSLAAGDKLDLGDIPLHNERMVSGRVYGSRRRGVRTLLRFERADAHERQWFGIADPHPLLFKSDKDGRFRLRGMGPGTWVISAGGEDLALKAVEVDTFDGPVEDLELHLADPHKVRLKVDPATLNGSALLTIFDDANRPLWRQVAEETAHWELPLAPGSYSLAIRSLSGGERMQAFEVGAGDMDLIVKP